VKLLFAQSVSLFTGAKKTQTPRFGEPKSTIELAKNYAVGVKRAPISNSGPFYGKLA
jgi:hypothetical protein